MNKFLLVLATLLCCTQLHAQIPVDSVRVAQFRITGVSCAGDLPIIEKKLVNAEGVDEVEFSPIQMGEVVVHVDYHPALLNEEQLVKLVESAPSCDAPGEYPYRVRPGKKR